MYSPVLSVIVPVYNAAAFLRRCLDSLLGQRCQNLEIICVNDGSTDKSSAILDEYAASNVRVRVIHQSNAGVSVARNRGLDAATGEFLTFVDADDWLEPEAYEKAAVAMSEGVDLVCFGTHVDGEIDPVYRDILVRHLAVQARCRAPLAPELQVELGCEIWNKLYRREILEAGGVFLCFCIGDHVWCPLAQKTCSAFARRKLSRPTRQHHKCHIV